MYLVGFGRYATTIRTEQQDMGLEFHLLTMRVSELAANWLVVLIQTKI
ncbi:hypothetical protein TSMEX_000853 [Taenia solium]|eukprot:TsM_000353800 transcript=TsM_000353800 gene=TsM_000353800